MNILEQLFGPTANPWQTTGVRFGSLAPVSQPSHVGAAPPTASASPHPAPQVPAAPTYFPQSSGMDDLSTFLAGMGEGGGALLPAIGAGSKAVANEKMRRDTINQTFQFLLRNGVNEADARAIMGNGELLKLKLGEIFAPKTQKVGAGEVIIDSHGHKIFDNSENGRPTSEITNFRFSQDNPGFQEFLKLHGKDGGAYGKTGAIMQGSDGQFYTVQFGANGQKLVEPLRAGEAGLTPAKGVQQVGDELVNKATGQVVRNVGANLKAEEVAKGEGKAIADIRKDLPADRQRLAMVTGNLDRLEKAATDLAQQPGLDKVAGGLAQAYLPNVSEEARNAGTALANLKVQISGAVLQAMRDASKTGGAVGQVTEREWPRLENMIANLDPSQGKAQFLQNLGEVVKYAQGVKTQLQAAYDADAQRAASGSLGGGTTDDPAKALRNKYGLE